MPITRRRFLATSALAASAALWPMPSFSADSGFTELRRGVGTFVGRGGTIGWLAAPDAVVVVDTQFPDTAALFLEGLQARSGRRIDLLVNTHHHGDHTAGNAVLRPQSERHVAHARVPGLQTRSYEQSLAAGREAAAPVTPADTYDEAWQANLGDEILHLRYYGPAHTSGDSVVHFERADVVHMGDLLFNRLPPYIDLGAGASIEGWIALLEAVHAGFSDETLFIYGHGHKGFGVTGRRADLLVMRDFLTGLLAYARTGLAAGKSLDELVAVTHLPGFPDHVNPDWPASLPNAIRAAATEVEGR